LGLKCGNGQGGHSEVRGFALDIICTTWSQAGQATSLQKCPKLD